MPPRKLTPPDIKQAADFLAVTTAHIHAVLDVEAAGSGFDSRGRIKRLFEPHLFHKYTHGKFDKSHPHLSYAAWQPGHYGNADKQVAQWTEAEMLDRHAACISTSWGLPQILGSNANDAGYTTAEEMVAAMIDGGEPEQLAAFVRVLDEWDLEGALRSGNWVKFARRYNGKSYQKHDYDGQLRRAFAKWWAIEGRPELPAPHNGMLESQAARVAKMRADAEAPNTLTISLKPEHPTATISTDKPPPTQVAPPAVTPAPDVMAKAEAVPQPLEAPTQGADVQVTTDGHGGVGVLIDRAQQAGQTLARLAGDQPPVKVFLQSLKMGREAIGTVFTVIISAALWAKEHPGQIAAVVVAVAAVVVLIHFARMGMKLVLDLKTMTTAADPHKVTVIPDKDAHK